jgi:crotonobetainyl-CoA:carnitine CoA-transferase CaiB-like acyl-CoA transferase
VATAGTVLGGLGAEVIKIEPPKMDGWRLTAVAPGVDTPWERGPMFTNFNLNKKGVVLDLASPRGKEIFLDLVAQSDALIENFSPRVMTNLGLGFDRLHERNPALVQGSISGYGAVGPWRDFVAHGLSFEQASGFASLTGYREDGLPRGINAYSDSIVGHWTALAVCGALEYRRRTGIGQHLDVSAFEVLATFLGGVLAEHQVSGAVPKRIGNRHPSAAPHGLYACAGDDAWVAAAATSDEQWRALRRALGDPEWARDPRYDSLAGRKANEDDLDAALTAWTSERSREDVVATLQAAGVPAEIVVAPEEQLAAPDLGGAGMFTFIDRPVSGRVAYPRLPARLDGAMLEPLLHAPLFGEHTREVLGGLLGLPPDEVDALYAAGITRTVPLGYG